MNYTSLIILITKTTCLKKPTTTFSQLDLTRKLKIPEQKLLNQNLVLIFSRYCVLIFTSRSHHSDRTNTRLREYQKYEDYVIFFGIHEILLNPPTFILFYNLHEENMFTIKIEDRLVFI